MVIEQSEGWGARPLEGVTVLELGTGIGVRYCARLLALLGADVVRGADRGDADIGETPAARAYERWLDDARSTGTTADRRWDLVLAGQGPADLDAGRALVERLDGEPTLVELTWFSADGPYAGWRGNDEVVLALCGLAYAFGPAEGPPTLARGHVPQILAGANACNLALAALLAPPDRRPSTIAVEVLESAMCLTETGAVAHHANPRAVSTRVGVDRFVPTYPCSSYRASDGWVGITCLTPAQWGALCREIGREDLLAEEAYATAARRLWRGDEVDAALAPAVAERTCDEWVAVGLARRIPITSMPEPGQLPSVEHWRRRGSFAAVDGDDIPGAPLVPTMPSVVRWDGHPRGRWEVDVEVDGPLSGLRVLDLTMGWAGPSTTRTLADLGADVVKVESESHPDWWRGWEARTDADPPTIEVQPHFNATNRSKRSVAIDIGSDEGRATVLALVDHADVVIENFAAGVLDRLGLGADVLQARRPGLVVVSMPAFGSEGPLAGVRAYGSTVEQASGLPFVNGREGWPPAIQHVAFGDPVGGLYGVGAVLAALAGRARLGGAIVDLSQVACLFQLGADAIVAAQVDGRLERTGNRRPGASPCCVVPATGDEEWLAVVVDGADAWTGLCAVLGRAPSGDRAERADEVEAAIAAWARERSASEAAELLQAAGVPAAPVQPAHSLGSDPHLVATGYWQELERRYVRRHLLGGPAFRLDGHRPVARWSAPTLGEHTDAVLSDPRWTDTLGD